MLDADTADDGLDKIIFPSQLAALLDIEGARAAFTKAITPVAGGGGRSDPHLASHTM